MLMYRADHESMYIFSNCVAVDCLIQALVLTFRFTIECLTPSVITNHIVLAHSAQEKNVLIFISTAHIFSTLL